MSLTLSNRLIRNHSWADPSPMEIWIKSNDTRYQFLKNNLINIVFPVLQAEDKTLLLDGLIKIINLIYVKFGFANNASKNETLLWDQLTQNNLLDLRALLGNMLPFISDNENDDKKHNLKNLADLYLVRDDRGTYVYTNSQYNRCIRHKYKKETKIFFRPFLKEYFYQHLQLLLMSIEAVSNKLYVNWVDVLPVLMNQYQSSQLYIDTKKKITVDKLTGIDLIDLIDGYIDPSPGLSYFDIYNVMSNHLYHEIKIYKWLIYDIIVDGNATPYLLYLENKFNLDIIWENLLWSQLENGQRNTFTIQWNNFLSSPNINDNTILNKFYFFFAKYHVNAKQLINRGELILTSDPADQEDNDEENAAVTPQSTRNAVIGMGKVPAEEIYLFIYNQLTAFRKSWFYYAIKIKKLKYLGVATLNGFNGDVDIYITPKNIYNYCKSLVHYVGEKQINGVNVYYEMPRHWYSLKPDLITMALIRILDIENTTETVDYKLMNDWNRLNWFNVNKYLRRLYPLIIEDDLVKTNKLIHLFIRSQLTDIIFESLIYHGLLSDFVPDKAITNNRMVESSIGSTDDRKKTNFKRSQMKERYFTGGRRTDYETDAYYFVTNSTYGNLKSLLSKDYPAPKYDKAYFDFLTSDQIWTFTYAMNWVSQINFFHHYMNNRIIYVTGATGVGKSTQVPKLLLYGQVMLDYNINGKIICTQPRVSPTVENAETISRELGVPIRAYNSLYESNVFTNNYQIQYKHQKEEHRTNSDSFLRIVTDGTLYEEMKRSPFMCKTSPDAFAVDSKGNPIPWVKKFSSGNKYDIIIVDEAHEHNPNMDMILTLARDAVYVNNSLKLVIVSATMEDDEPIYRRYYRQVNDNRAFPLSSFIEFNKLDRANTDRRIHISPPGATTQYEIKDYYLSQAESDLINVDNFVDYGIKRTIELASKTTEKDILLFLSGQADIVKAVKEINENTASNIIAMGFYSELSEETKNMIIKIHQTLGSYTRFKEDVALDEDKVTRRVPPGTYTRAIIIATNVAEASITLQNLKYVVDTGYAKTNIYDALEGVNKMLTLPISNSSSLQRRGRVGRVASGEVYYLYSREKIMNNKTAYKIADSNIKDHLIPLLKSDPNDSPIINPDNDINYILNIAYFQDKLTSLEYTTGDILYEVLKNPHPYIDIIKKQYLYIADMADISQYYLYYGKTDNIEYNLTSLTSNLTKYMLDNHDDYHYQMTNPEFISKGYTGYDDFRLEDNTLSFFIIHPDENVITRNFYTGKMEAIKCNPAVTDSYYYYLLKTNNIKFDPDDITKCKFNVINFSNFYLTKYYLAIDDAKLQMLVIDIPDNIIDLHIRYTNVKNDVIAGFTKIFFDLATRKYPGDRTSTIKSTQLDNLNDIQKLSSLPILNNINNLVWYAYSIPYNLENDALALMLFMENVPDLKNWFDSKVDVNRIVRLHASSRGDIYFIWQMWSNIKNILISNNTLELTEIDVQLQLKFNNYKSQFARNIKIPLNEYLILDKMYKSGQLHSQHEFYYYVSQITFDESLLKTSGIAKYISITAKDNLINPTVLIDFVQAYVELIFTQNKKVWMYQYEYDNKLAEEPTETNIIEWAQTKLLSPSISKNPHYIPKTWDLIVQVYIRAFSMNLLNYDGRSYLRINKGIRMDPAYWSKKVKIEKTFLKNKSSFVIYHTSQTIRGDINVIYLTPTTLDWVIQLNPYYYYYLFFDKSNILYSMKQDKDILKAQRIIQSGAQSFDFNALLTYLDQQDNPTLTRLIRDNIASSR